MDYQDHRPISRELPLIPHVDDIRQSMMMRGSLSSQYGNMRADTRSWVYSTNQNAPRPPPPHAPPHPPPPAPIPGIPPPVQRLRPLPNMNNIRNRSLVLHAANQADNFHDEDELDNQYFHSNGFASGLGHPTEGLGINRQDIAVVPRDKKRSFVGGFVKGIRRLPKKVFRSNSDKRADDDFARRGEKGIMRKRVNLDSDQGTEGSFSGMPTADALPQYVPNSPTSFPVSCPSDIQYPRPMQREPTIPESPLPDVVRLDDVRRHHPSFRISPPHENLEREQSAQFIHEGEGGSRRFSNIPETEPSVPDTADRTTVMVYNTRRSQLPEPPTPTPQTISRQISNGLRLSSITGSELLVHPKRSSFFINTQAPPLSPPRPPPLEIPQTSIDYREGPRVSEYTPQQTPRPPPSRPAPPTRPIRRPVQPIKASPLSQPQASSSAPPRHPLASSNLPQNTYPNASFSPPPIVPPPPPVPLLDPEPETLSPVTAHPLPANDYLKMSLSPEPSLHRSHPRSLSHSPKPHTSQPHSHLHSHHTSHAHSHSRSGSGVGLSRSMSRRKATSTFSSNPSFSSDRLTPLERFFKVLYYMPWVARERVTVDFLPGSVGDGRRGFRGFDWKNFISSWGGKGKGGGDARVKVGGRRGEVKVKKDKPKSWYQGVFSSRRASLEMLSNGLGLGSTTLGARLEAGALGLQLDAPHGLGGMESDRRRKEGRHKTHRHGHRHDHSSRHHRREHKHGHHEHKQGRKHSTSSAQPVVYPFQYPAYSYPYPYPGYPPYPTYAAYPQAAYQAMSIVPPPPPPTTASSSVPASSTTEHHGDSQISPQPPKSVERQQVEAQHRHPHPHQQQQHHYQASTLFQPMLAPMHGPHSLPLSPQVYFVSSVPVKAAGGVQAQLQAQGQPQTQQVSASASVETRQTGDDVSVVAIGGAGAAATATANAQSIPGAFSQEG
ncbi:hypothetical protein B0H34DRAFT_803187 [Crassisporium funariophilum]|nr:hypothetical protein B0H34DRAFT_803187 [Crassisporium funariophilum]